MVASYLIKLRLKYQLGRDSNFPPEEEATNPPHIIALNRM